MTKFLDWFPVWFFTNALVTAVFIMGNETEYTFFAAGVAILAWVMLVTSAFLVLAIILHSILEDDFKPEDNSALDELYKKYGKRGPVFVWMDLFYDAFMFAIFYTYGWEVTAIAYAIAALGQQAFFHSAMEYCEKEQKCSA